MSKNSELMQQQMEKHPGMRLVVEQEENPPVIHEKRNGYARMVHLDLDAAAPEAFLKLAESISLSKEKESPWIVVLAGIDAGESCSRIVARAAKILARSGLGKVCLVDAYFHSPSLSEFFAFGSLLGLTDALHLGGSILDFTIPDHKGKLSLVPRGSFPAESANQHDLDAVKNWLDELRREFDSVLINAPPLNRSADGIAFGKLADSLVPVLEASTTHASSGAAGRRESTQCSSWSCGCGLTSMS